LNNHVFIDVDNFEKVVPKKEPVYIPPTKTIQTFYEALKVHGHSPRAHYVIKSKTQVRKR
jgi:hypothetical protein